jgi:Kdo2-lipid IVA lauroyltransferase/acyltransferase
MMKLRSRTADYAVYLLVRVTVCFVQVLSWDGALALARGLAWLVYHLNPRHRRVAAENLHHAFPALDASARDALVRATYEHLLTVVVEMIRLPRTLTRANHARYIECRPEDLGRLQVWWASNRPMLVIAGHFGNWEVLSYLTGLLGFRGGIIARRLDNPYLDRFLATFRKKTGLVLLDKSRDYERILGTLARGGALGMLGDQDAGRRGLFVDFFGRPASTFKSIALLSLEYAAPIFVLGAARVGHPLRYRIYVEEIIAPEEYAGRADAPRAITQRYTAALERMVRRHPEQYFWLHRRWKHQPQARSKRAA